MGNEGNIPNKTAVQRKRLRKRSNVRRHGMSYKPSTRKVSK